MGWDSMSVDPPIISIWLALIHPWFLIKPKCLMVPSSHQGHMGVIPYYRRKFRSQTSDNMEKQRWEEPEKRREEKRKEERRSGKRKSQKTEDAGARKGSKVAKHGVFQTMCGSGGSKSRLAKAASASTHVVWKWDIKLETGRCYIIHIRY